MHLPDKQSDELTTLANKSKNQVRELLKGLTPTGGPISLTRSDDIFANTANTSVFLIETGQLQYFSRGKLAYVAESGDLVGLPRALQQPPNSMIAQQPVTLIPYERDQLLAHVNRNQQQQQLWTSYLVSVCAFFHEGLAQEVRNHFQPAAGFLHFSAGETIIKQDGDADCVYTLLEGKAQAVRDGIKVGDIHAEEIFGAMAVFTREKRGASVVALDDCTVMAVRKEDFIDLIDSQPRVCLSLIEEMASKINQLNAHILELQRNKHH